MTDRIERLGPEDLTPELARLLSPRIERLGYLGEFFQVTAHQPKALWHFYRLTEELKESVPDNLTETVALTVATALENDYERVQHERLSLKLGLPESWVRQVRLLDPDQADQLSQQERVVQQLALSIVRSYGQEGSAPLEPLVAEVGEKLAVGILLLIGRYVMHAVISNCLQLAAPALSPLDK